MAPVDPSSKAGAGHAGDRVLVVGVAGGIGSGKSALARAFEGLGFEILDADAEAKAALDRPEVRHELVGWWGERILDEHRRVDRRSVAQIVFEDGASRERLESLVHPIVIGRCEDVARRATRAGRAGVVIDAPLLFEAGLEGMCDAVVFVAADDDIRAARVSKARGWDAEEIGRREAVQMALEEKRGRSRFVVENNSTDLSVLEAEASRIYDILCSEAESRRDRNGSDSFR